MGMKKKKTSKSDQEVLGEQLEQAKALMKLMTTLTENVEKMALIKKPKKKVNKK